MEPGEKRTIAATFSMLLFQIIEILNILGLWSPSFVMETWLGMGYFIKFEGLNP